MSAREFWPWQGPRPGEISRKSGCRWNTPWQAHGLTFSCYRRQAFLSKDRTRQYLADAVNRVRDRHGFQVWAGHAQANIRNAKALRDFFTYIHHNPVKRGLVAQPEDWQWSSARDWNGLAAGPIPIDKQSFIDSAV